MFLTSMEELAKLIFFSAYYSTVCLDGMAFKFSFTLSLSSTSSALTDMGEGLTEENTLTCFEGLIGEIDFSGLSFNSDF